MAKINFKLKKMESKYKEAKIVEFDNKQKSIINLFPAVMFDVQSNEDLASVEQYYFQQSKSMIFHQNAAHFSRNITLQYIKGCHLESLSSKALLFMKIWRKNLKKLMVLFFN